MTQVALGVAELLEFMEDDKKNKCEYKPKEMKWTAKLSGSGRTLGANLGNKPDATKESELSSEKFPSQAHHLIPNARLHPDAKGSSDNPPHIAHQLLKEGDFLFGDTDYDINHKNNGKWMPYAHRLQEWTSKRKTETKVRGKTSEEAKKIRNEVEENNKRLMFLVMKKANIQMHQGSHSCTRFGVGEAGYLTRVDQYLDKIRNKASSHFAGEFKCGDCTSKKQDNKFPPRENTIRYFDKASGLIEIDINKCRIFVSEEASKFHEDIGFVIKES